MKRVLTIAPGTIDEDFEHKQRVLTDIAKRLDLKIQFPPEARSHEVFDLGRSRREFRESDLVFADLTLERPSCYFELGIAECLERPLVLIAKSGTAIHQTAHRSSVQFYDGMGQYATISESAFRSICGSS